MSFAKGPTEAVGGTDKSWIYNTSQVLRIWKSSGSIAQRWRTPARLVSEHGDTDGFMHLLSIDRRRLSKFVEDSKYKRQLSDGRSIPPAGFGLYSRNKGKQKRWVTSY